MISPRFSLIKRNHFFLPYINEENFYGAEALYSDLHELNKWTNGPPKVQMWTQCAGGRDLPIFSTQHADALCVMLMLSISTFAQ